MIAKLKGTLEEKKPGEVVVDVGGVGYCAAVSLTTFCRLPEPGETVSLYVVTNLRENALELFAFHDRRERALFNLLRSVSGIGSRVALAVLGGLDADELVEAVAAGAVDRLVAVPGVGRKTAERIVVELKDKMGGERRADLQIDARPGVESDAVSALVSLGYKEPQARKAVSACVKQANGNIESLIRSSLAQLS
jgi:Holliday junction DNA helicase RuvA